MQRTEQHAGDTQLLVWWRRRHRSRLHYPNMRLFNIPPQYSNTTLDQAATSYSGGWVLPSASTLQDPNNWSDVWDYFSATCYWAGKDIYDSLNGDFPSAC